MMHLGENEGLSLEKWKNKNEMIHLIELKI